LALFKRAFDKKQRSNKIKSLKSLKVQISKRMQHQQRQQQVMAFFFDSDKKKGK
jgi:hypothetical protein